MNCPDRQALISEKMFFIYRKENSMRINVKSHNISEHFNHRGTQVRI